MVWGHLLVIPIEQSLLYVKPVYLQTTGGGEQRIPELKKVIVAYGDSRVMADTLEQGLARIFGTGSTITTAAASSKPPTPPTTTVAQPSLKELIDQLAETLRFAEEAQRQGNWAEYGRQLERVKSLVKTLQSQTQ